MPRALLRYTALIPDHSPPREDSFLLLDQPRHTMTQPFELT